MKRAVLSEKLWHLRRGESCRRYFLLLNLLAAAHRAFCRQNHVDAGKNNDCMAKYQMEVMRGRLRDIYSHLEEAGRVNACLGVRPRPFRN